MAQCILRRHQPRLPIGAEQGQRAERSLDRAAQPVVDDYPVEAVGRKIGQLLSGCGVRQLGGLTAGGDDHDPAVGRLAQPVVAERLQDRYGARVAEPAERNDRLFLVREAGAAEPGDDRRQILGPRRQRGEQQDQCERGETE